MLRFVGLVLLVPGLLLGTAAAQTVKIGVLTTYSGPNGDLGDQTDRGMSIFLKEHQNELPPGVKIELVKRDDTGPFPEVAKRLAQELITRDHVAMLLGGSATPNAAAMISVVDQAKVPFIILNSAGSALVRMSPYVVRVSFTFWQSAYPMGQWAAQHGIANVFTSATDYSGGREAADGFIKGFTEGGGKIVGSIYTPLISPDFAPFLQRVKDANPGGVFVFIQGGAQSLSYLKTFQDVGLASAGVKIIGTGDLTDDDPLPSLGDLALGIITTHHYSAAATRPANRAFVAAYHRDYPSAPPPNYGAVAGYDGMAAVFDVVREQKGHIDPDRTMALLKGWKYAASPRGPIMIDPETRDIVQNEYIRRVERVDGALANVEFETIPAVKDPWVRYHPQ